MDKDTIIANTITIGAAGLYIVNIMPYLTMAALCIGIIANLISIRKNIK
jgi:hypothetical protein